MLPVKIKGRGVAAQIRTRDSHSQSKVPVVQTPHFNNTIGPRPLRRFADPSAGNATAALGARKAGMKRAKSARTADKEAIDPDPYQIWARHRAVT